MSNDMTSAILVVFIAALLLLGVLLVIFPRTVQRMALQSVDHGATARLKAQKTFIGSNAYLWNVRIVGCISIAMGVLLLFAR